VKESPEKAVNPAGCRGRACQFIEIKWDSVLAGYNIANRSGRPVSIVLPGSSGATSLRLPAHATRVIFVSEFEPPWTAEFCDEPAEFCG
jgi:hypothetical protein